MKLSQIQMRDPFVFPLPEKQLYLLFGSTDANPWSIDGGVGFDYYRSCDLKEWEGPFPAFRPTADFPFKGQFWAPECHRWKDKYYLFATFKNDSIRRGTYILRADHPEGPYSLWSESAITPAEWECLDGTLSIDSAGSPWMVFCHEWVQISCGTICAIRISADFRRSEGEPVTLFKATDAKWCRECPAPGKYVTDGPFLFHSGGRLLMLWSGFGDTGYTMGLAESKSGDVTGPWFQYDTPVFSRDGGHGMYFTAFDGKKYITVHRPNISPNERPHFIEKML